MRFLWLPILLLVAACAPDIEKAKAQFAELTQGYQIDPTQNCSGHDREDCLGYTYGKAGDLYPRLAERFADIQTVDQIDARTYVERLSKEHGYSSEFKAAMAALANGKSREAFVTSML